MDSVLAPLSNQWQLALLALICVMGAMLWRGHRQVTALAGTSQAMQDELQRLAKTANDICGLASTTEQTLVANLAEYRMALGNTSTYRAYLQRLGVAPAGDVEPILEAMSDGAMAVSREGKILYVNNVLATATDLTTDTSVQEMVDHLEMREFDGRRLTVSDLPVTQVLRGETIKGQLVRMRSRETATDAILSLSGCPVRDALGRVVAAIIVAKPVSEEVALAMEVRRSGQVTVPPATTTVIPAAV